MSSQPEEEPRPSPPADIPWESAVRFVRQLSHDLRNHLNAVELQSAFLGEIATDAEMKDEVKRLRQMLSGLGGVLQKLSADMGQRRPNFMEYKASDFLDDVRRSLESGTTENAAPLTWDIDVGEATLNIDPQLLQQAIQELVANARRQAPGDGPIKVSARSDEKTELVLTLEEPKESFELDTVNWGHTPLRSVSPGHYGLGLNYVRTVIEMHRGRFRAEYEADSKHLRTTVTLPLRQPQSSK